MDNYSKEDLERKLRLMTAELENIEVSEFMPIEHRKLLHDSIDELTTLLENMV